MSGPKDQAREAVQASQARIVRWSDGAPPAPAEATLAALVRAEAATPAAGLDAVALARVEARLRRPRRLPFRLRLALTSGALVLGLAGAGAAAAHLSGWRPLALLASPTTQSPGRAARGHRQGSGHAAGTRPAVALPRSVESAPAGAAIDEGVVPVTAAPALAPVDLARTPVRPRTLALRTTAPRIAPAPRAPTSPAWTGSTLGRGSSTPSAKTAPPAPAPFVPELTLVPAPLEPRPALPSALAGEAALLAEALAQLRRSRDGAAALGTLDRYAARHPQGVLAPEAARARIDALFLLGQRTQARRVLDTLALETRGRDLELTLVRGELRAADDCRGAERDFTGVLASRAPGPLLARALVGRAACRARRGDARGAAEDRARAAQLRPATDKNGEVRRNL